MKKLKLLVLMLISLFFVGVNANAEEVKSINTFNDLVEFATSGGSAKLESDITLTSHVGFSQSALLDLNGHIINTNGNYVLIILSDVTIKDASSNALGKILNDKSYTQMIQIGGSSNVGNLTIESGTIDGLFPTYLLNGTITLNGGAIEGEYPIYAVGGTAVVNGGLIRNTGSSNAVQLKNAKIVVNDGSISALDGYGIVAFENSEVEVNGGKIEAKWYPITGNGSKAGTSNSGVNAKFKVTGGTLIGLDSPAIYSPQIDGETIITGGTLTGVESAVEIRAGKLNITGGILNGNLEKYEIKENGNGTTTIGAAVAISQHTTKQPIEVNISGGTFKAYLPISEANPQKNTEADVGQIKLNITGGTFITTGNTVINSEDLTNFVVGGNFNKDIELKYLSENYSSKLKNDSYVVGLNTIVESEDNNVIFKSEKPINNTYRLVVVSATEEKISETKASIIEDYKNNNSIKDLNLLALYEISLMDGDNVIPMENGNFTIEIALDKDLSIYDNYKVIYIDDEGNMKEKIDAKLIDGNIVFETSHLSTYAVIGYNNTVEKNPNTGDNLISYILIGLVSLFVGSIVIKKLKIAYNS